jgi:nucleotide-binding universal stress UspA family protein
MFIDEKVMEERKAALNAAAKYLEKITEEFKSEGITAKYFVEEGGVDTGFIINRYTQTNHMDLVIIATHGRSGAQRWAFGSVANKVMMGGNTPLILIRTPFKT